jgi:hypothetical protein
LKKLVWLLVLTVVPMWGVDTPLRQVPVEITNPIGSFSGQLAVLVKGNMYGGKAEWNGTIRNTSPNKIFQATFCVKAFDAADQQIEADGKACIITLSGGNWEPGESLNFKGKQSITLGHDKIPVQVARYAVIATEVFDHSPNLRTIDASCPLVWSSALRVFADKKFRPTVMDKGSFTAAYAYDGGRIDTGSTSFLKEYTTANTGWRVTWQSFKIESASLYLRQENPGTCTAEVKMSFAGFGEVMTGEYKWYDVESNFKFEKNLLDELEAQSRKAANDDLNKAVSQVPTEAPKPVEGAANPQLTITSAPSGAEIEINGEFIGNTPTTVSAKPGKVVVKVKKAGLQPWERTLMLNAGDKRTLNAEW